MNDLFYDSYEQQALTRLIQRKRQYLYKLPHDSNQAPWIVSEINTLEEVLRALTLSQSTSMSELTKDIVNSISAAVKIPGSENLQGMLYYYRFRTPDEERRNLLAIAGGGPRDELRIKEAKLFDGYEECPVELIRL